MPVHRRRYFQLVERDTYKISSSWKVFHALIFILIVVMSFISALTFHDIFESFNFQCILYGKPEIHLDEIVYFTTTTPASTTPASNTSVSTTPASNTSVSTTSVSTASAAGNVFTLTITTTIPETTTPILLTENITEVKPKKEPLKIEIKGKSYWASNSTLRAQVMVNHRKTVYGTRSLCNAVLFFPLATLVFGTFAAVIVIICGRGGRGYMTDLFPQPWLYVCPLLILSIIMLIINSILEALLSQGMYQFCSAFKKYTGHERCSKKINYFTDDEGFGVFDLYETYYMCIVSFTAGVILWALQVALLVMRVIFVVDFQLVMVRVSCRRRHSLGLEDDQVTRVLMNSFGGLRRVALVGEHYYHKEAEKHQGPMTPHRTTSKKKVTFFDEPGSSSEDSSRRDQVHQALTKSHKLKKVTFDDKKDTKKSKDDDDDVTQV